MTGVQTCALPICQLLAAPAWAFALLALGNGMTGKIATGTHAAAWLALALAVLLALPGTTGGRGLLEVPGGADEAEPSAAVRAISGLSHHAWIGAWAAFAALAFAPGARPLGFIAAILGALLALLALRALVTGTFGARTGAVLLGGAWTLALLDLGVHALLGRP